MPHVQVEFPLGQFEPFPAQEMLLSLLHLLAVPAGIVELEGAVQDQGSRGFSTFRHPLHK